MNSENVRLLHPEIVTRYGQMADAGRDLGVHIFCTSGYRHPGEQAALFAKGRDADGNVIDRRKVVTWAPPGLSWHNYALAYDIAFMRFNPDGSRDHSVDPWAESHPWELMARIGRHLGLTPGYFWPEKKQDRPHFELTPGFTVPAGEDRAKAMRAFADTMWKQCGKEPPYVNS